MELVAWIILLKIKNQKCNEDEILKVSNKVSKELKLYTQQDVNHHSFPS